MEDLRREGSYMEFIDGKVSIVTPVYNGERYLSSMLDSVLEQTYPQIEMILVDDGSTDNTIRIAESYCDKFTEKGYEYHIIHSSHKNASAAINQGLPYVTGEYLIWPDSDDRLESKSIEERVTFLEHNLQYQCVRTGSYYFDEKTGNLCLPDEAAGDLSKEDLFWDILESKTYVCCGCYMLRSKIFFHIYPDRRIPEYNVGQNFQMLLPFMFQNRCPTILKQLYGVRIRKDSHSRKMLSQAEEEQKYREYEALIDEITALCGIKDKASQIRIFCWKIRRRYLIALKYGRKKQALASLFQLVRYKDVKLENAVKKGLWVCFSDTWVIKKIYPICRECMRYIIECVEIFLGIREIKEVYFCRKSQIALTFDDGYNYTPEILDKLKQYNSKATFFLVGDWIEKEPENYRRIVNEGHEVGNHSYTHSDMSTLTKREVLWEINKTQQLSEKIIGDKPRLFRFPYGKSDKHMIRLIKSNGMIPIGYSIVGYDWKGMDADEICRNILNNKKLQNGAIILLHTNHKNTVQALDSLIPALNERGYQLVRVSDLISWRTNMAVI